jgi:RNA polymerase sigma-70 factor (ECF subfamily)
MTQVGGQPAATTPTDPIRSTLDDPTVLEELRRHALARLGWLLADQPWTAQQEIAADVVQETCQRALQHRERFDPNHGKSPAAWLHGILNLVVKEQCRSLRKHALQAADLAAKWDLLAERMSAPNAAEELAEFLAQLPEDQRQIIQLHHLDDVSHEQIAAQLGISVGCSRVRLGRAMKALRELVAKEVGR